ncbi:asparagine synthase B [Apilactobacillus sp. M161]|uniref:asparagine synthase (glutamine-hydrolyzing) n=1 Tax=Apilactobacillus xinyiensis TaxID=2841032 RepID=A0ABT0I0F1_9LACO|nr:asparagine synthase B [Apilactobacillus xinyiensis]MCK8624310.1 asparagine synthase B [Apilactobacillus xinyiensis]
MCGFLAVDSMKFDLKTFDEALEKNFHRGPDMTSKLQADEMMFGFNRLAIMDLSDDGMQPFKADKCTLVCNGEIYNYLTLKDNLKDDYEFESGSDCEVLIPLYRKYGLDTMCKMLDAEFAFVLYDQTTKKVMAARDPVGIRPMFYGYTKEDNQIAFGSTAKTLMPLCDKILPFPPGHYYDGEKFVCYHDPAMVSKMITPSLKEATKGIHDRLVAAVKKRLQSDAPVGYLLSGGLDSSLVCSIASKLKGGKPIKTFAIGMDRNPIDLKYAREVADYLGTDHTEFIMTREDVLGALRDVIYTLETWDITTIRASIGMYLLCKNIHETTDLKVILTGECSDEMFGYKYTDYAPNAEEFQKEAMKRVRELYMYDVLRADRCISSNSLEGRVPFADKDFMEYVMSIDPAMKMNKYDKGKYLLREAFAGQDYLSDDILMREKAAFSDAVGHSLVDDLKAYADEMYTDEDVAKAKDKYEYRTPFTKESLLYRDIFEEYFPGKASWIKDFWMPNKNWENCDVDDPSARVLKNYGDSGK